MKIETVHMAHKRLRDAYYGLEELAIADDSDRMYFATCKDALIELEQRNNWDCEVLYCEVVHCLIHCLETKYKKHMGIIKRLTKGDS